MTNKPSSTNHSLQEERARKNKSTALKLLALALLSFFGFVLATWLRGQA